jgi:phage shock protein A
MLNTIKKWFSKPVQINMSQDYYDGLKQNISVLRSDVDTLRKHVSDLETKNAELKKTLNLKEAGFRKILTGKTGQKVKEPVSKSRKSSNISNAQREIWANYTPEQRANRNAKMQAGRHGVTIS